MMEANQKTPAKEMESPGNAEGSSKSGPAADDEMDISKEVLVEGKSKHSTYRPIGSAYCQAEKGKSTTLRRGNPLLVRRVPGAHKNFSGL